MDNSLSAVLPSDGSSTTIQSSREVAPPSAASAARRHSIGNTMPSARPSSQVLNVPVDVRAERLREGLCPTCGIRLFKISKKNYKAVTSCVGNGSNGGGGGSSISSRGPVRSFLFRHSIGFGGRSNNNGSSSSRRNRNVGAIESLDSSINDNGNDSTSGSQSGDNNSRTSSSLREASGGRGRGGAPRIPLTVEGQVFRGQCLRCSAVQCNQTNHPPQPILFAPSATAIPLEEWNAQNPQQLQPCAVSGPAATISGPAAAVSGPAAVSGLAGTVSGMSATTAASTMSATTTSADLAPPTVAIPIANNGNPLPERQTSTATYSGQLNEHGQHHGFGIMLWDNGDRYEGTFWNGMRDGEGTLNFGDGTEYVGSWRLNKMDGEGTRRYLDGSVYTGEYRWGKRHGLGRCYFANGDMYYGDWREDNISGYGRYHYHSGACYEGNFKFGKREGRGKYQLKDGRIDIYRYMDDRHCGEGARWSKDRKKAWRLVDGKVREKVSLEDACRIAERCGPIVEV